jgi:hypothetical protein
MGFSSLSHVTFESAGYVARYVTKKWTHQCDVNCEIPCLNQEEFHYRWTDPRSGKVFLRDKERTVALSKGIGKGWLEKWKHDVYPADEIIMRGKAMKPPRYYDYLLEKWEPSLSKEVLKERKWQRKLSEERKLKKKIVEPSMISREKCAKARLDSLKRGLEKVTLEEGPKLSAVC